MTFPVTSLCSRMMIGSHTTSVCNTSVSRENKAMQGVLMLWRRGNHWLKHFWIIEPGQWDWPEDGEAIQSGEQASRVEAAPGCSTVTDINKWLNTVKNQQTNKPASRIKPSHSTGRAAFQTDTANKRTHGVYMIHHVCCTEVQMERRISNPI